MARVVPRRTSPPYMLIAFVVLFLLATAAAVLLWVSLDDYKKNYGKMETTWKRIASPQEIGNPSPQINELLSNYDKGPQRQTVLSQLFTQIDDLTKSMTGSSTTYADANAKFHKLIADLQTTPTRGLITEARDLAQQVAAQKAEIDSMHAQIEELQGKLAEKNDALKKLTDDANAAIEQLNAEKRELENKVQTQHDSYEAEQTRLQQETVKLRNDLNKDITNKNQQIRELEISLSDKDQTLSRLREELEKKRGPLSGGAQSARQPDGKILQVQDRDKICYINIGAKDKVVPGLTFSVYPATGIPESGQGKATIVVTSVKDSVSECRITEQTGDPIIAGDSVANVAFDPHRSYVFVVEGDFDLHKRGSTSPEDAKEVKEMIKRFGGTLGDNVDVQTDFVVLGEEPKPIPRPSENAQETQWAAYHAQMQEYNHYQEVKKVAIDMHIPILNTNRFLALIGYATSPGRK